jgi:hypothetical protein
MLQHTGDKQEAPAKSRRDDTFISVICYLFLIPKQWQQDYETMQRTMIYGKSLPFDELIAKIKLLNERINRIDSFSQE